MNKLLYEIYRYERTYRTDLRNIKIFNNKDIEFVINRSTLKFRNKIRSLYGTKKGKKICLEKKTQPKKKYCS